MVTKTPWHRDIGGGKSRSYTAPAAGARTQGEPPKKKAAQPSRKQKGK